MISSLYDNIRLLFRKDKEPFLVLKGILGFYPRNIKLYRLALRHKSMAKDDKSMNNERLEFLGDAILGAIVADILYKRYGRRQEGFLTNLRSKIVCRKSLGQLAVKIGLDKLILHSDKANTSHNSYMNGNAFEAFFGAIYLDRGYNYCYKFVEDVILKTYINVEKLSQEDENHKSSLIEWCQKYQLRVQFSNQETREGSAPKFHCTARIEGVVCGEGDGYSKKESDQNAAKSAMRKIEREKGLKKMLLDKKSDAAAKAREQSRKDRALTQIKGRKTLVFDLDGTLMDTLKDLFLSTNYALRECGFEERSLADVKRFVGNGVGMLMKRAIFGESEDSLPENWKEVHEHCLAVFKDYYVAHCRDNTGLYPGIKELLSVLKEKGYKIAIVSNKMQSGVSELHNVWFKDYVEVAIGESEDVKRKPAPDMVQKALSELGSSTEEAVYIGDSEVDIQTAANSGIPCISVLWGFRDKDFLQKNGALVFAEKADDILSLL